MRFELWRYPWLDAPTRWAYRWFYCTRHGHTAKFGMRMYDGWPFCVYCGKSLPSPKGR